MQRLLTHEQCAEKVENKTANALDIFIHDNEPAGNEDSELFRNQLYEALKWMGDVHASIAWDAAQLSFAKSIGNDMSEEEEEGIIIYKNKTEYLKDLFKD